MLLGEGGGILKLREFCLFKFSMRHYYYFNLVKSLAQFFFSCTKVWKVNA